MTVSSYLNSLSNAAIIRDDEKLSINISTQAINNRLKQYFGSEITEPFPFGSYTRGTILPRSFDAHSDVDYMVVFRNSSYTPQTYLNRLKNFVENYYVRSEIAQSHPCIVLSLNHIKFELVPAVNNFWSGYNIPGKSSTPNFWISTNPNDVNSSLVQKNQSHGNLVKPLIRLVKYWNASNGYVFESFDLEKKVIAADLGGFWGTKPDLRVYFCNFMRTLYISFLDPQWKQDRVSKMKNSIEKIIQYENAGLASQAEHELKKLLPLPSSGLASRGLLS